MAQGLATLAVIPAIGTAAGGIAGLCVLSLGLIAVFGLSYGVAGVVAGSFAPPASAQHSDPHAGAAS